MLHIALLRLQVQMPTTICPPLSHPPLAQPSLLKHLVGRMSRICSRTALPPLLSSALMRRIDQCNRKGRSNSALTLPRRRRSSARTEGRRRKPRPSVRQKRNSARSSRRSSGVLLARREVSQQRMVFSHPGLQLATHGVLAGLRGLSPLLPPLVSSSIRLTLRSYQLPAPVRLELPTAPLRPRTV